MGYGLDLIKYGLICPFQEDRLKRSKAPELSGVHRRKKKKIKK